MRHFQQRLKRLMAKTPYYPVEKAPLYWIANRYDLEWMVSRLSGEKAIGVDTETNSLYAHEEKVCLVQIASWEEDFIIDPLAFSDQQDLAILDGLTSNSNITKIFHGADYDITGIKRDFGVNFNNIFDTYLSARYLRYEKIGLMDLVLLHFNIKLNKSLTKFNWAIRPLPFAEQKYAREDVRYIVPLMWQLQKELKAADIDREILVDFTRLAEKQWNIRLFEPNGFVKIKGVQDLSGRQLRALKELYLFREKKAKQYNIPPFKVISNETLLKLCKIEEDNYDSISQTKGLPGRNRQQIIQELHAILMRAQHRPPLEMETLLERKKKISEKSLHHVYFSKKQALIELKEWRNQQAANRIDSNAVLPNYVMESILHLAPKNLEELANIPYISESRVQKYGTKILKILDHCQV